MLTCYTRSQKRQTVRTTKGEILRCMFWPWNRNRAALPDKAAFLKRIIHSSLGRLRLQQQQMVFLTSWQTIDSKANWIFNFRQASRLLEERKDDKIIEHLKWK